MKILRYQADRWPIAIILFAFGLDLVVFFLAPTWRYAAAWTVLGIFHKACICSFNHHHQHLATFHSNVLNRLLEIPYGFLTGVTSHTWFLHHVIGHHQHYLDQSLDESRWKRDDGTPMRELEYATVVAATGYHRAFMAGKRHPKHRMNFVLMLLLQLTILGSFFWYNWQNALFVFLLPMAISLFLTAWHTYYHHCGLNAENDHEASWNITHKWYNILTGNLGYHTAHHLRGGLHWSKLPRFHDTIVEKIPDRLYRKPCIPFKWMPSI
ncbi:MAG: fatty acid desaturase [Lentisphaeria bacterium]|jgi:fatty acid desaturase|nr:fatty acid desaturase [Lentisphaeria bacterium]